MLDKLPNKESVDLVDNPVAYALTTISFNWSPCHYFDY